jgi:hypothetical protein
MLGMLLDGYVGRLNWLNDVFKSFLAVIDLLEPHIFPVLAITLSGFPRIMPY